MLRKTDEYQPKSITIWENARCDCRKEFCTRRLGGGAESCGVDLLQPSAECAQRHVRFIWPATCRFSSLVGIGWGYCSVPRISPPVNTAFLSEGSEPN